MSRRTLLAILFLVLSLTPYLAAQQYVAPTKPIAVLETNYGTIELELLPAISPRAVANFVGLVNKGYYNGLTFHRINDFMMQGGDPTATSTGGTSFFGQPFVEKCSSDVKFDQAGILALASACPNLNTSQFFITFKATPWLDGVHAIFGRVTKGLETLKKIALVETAKAPQPDKPIKDVVIISAKMK